MRKKNTEELGDALKRYLKAMKVDRKIMEVQVVKSWPDYVGGYIAQATKNIYIDNSVLFVQLYSSVVRNELMLIREPLREKINDQFEEEIVKDIVLR